MVVCLVWLNDYLAILMHEIARRNGGPNVIKNRSREHRIILTSAPWHQARTGANMPESDSNAGPQGWVNFQDSDSRRFWPKGYKPAEPKSFSLEATNDTRIIVEYKEDDGDNEYAVALFAITVSDRGRVWTLWFAKDGDSGWKATRVIACVWPGTPYRVAAAWMLNEFFRWRDSKKRPRSRGQASSVLSDQSPSVFTATDLPATFSIDDEEWQEDEWDITDEWENDDDQDDDDQVNP